MSCSGEDSGRGDGDVPSDCEPPDLLVGWDPEAEPPTTYRRTWGGTDDPTDEQVFVGIDDAYDDF